MQVFKGSLAVRPRSDRRGRERNDKDQEPIPELSERWEGTWSGSSAPGEARLDWAQLHHEQGQWASRWLECQV